PNPARGRLLVRLTLKHPGAVEVDALDLAGRRVRAIAAGELPAGSTTPAWDLQDGRGRRGAARAYLVAAAPPAGALTRRGGGGWRSCGRSAPRRVIGAATESSDAGTERLATSVGRGATSAPPAAGARIASDAAALLAWRRARDPRGGRLSSSGLALDREECHV